MITLPVSPAPNSVQPSLVDTGLMQRASGSLLRIDRPGMHMAADISYPPMTAAAARVFVSRLMRAKSEGLAMTWQLLGERQGLPGNPVVNVAGGASRGTALFVRGLNPEYVAKEGYWLNVTDADGERYLHNVAALVIAGSDGKAALSVWPPLREDFADGAAIEFYKPVIAGEVTSDLKWPLPVERLVTLSFTIEERV